eukprot:237911-Pelagomonas_calceolata.AAC.8
MYDALAYCLDGHVFCAEKSAGVHYKGFVGLAYLAHRPTTGYPAADIAARGVPISLDPSADQAASLAVRMRPSWLA